MGVRENKVRLKRLEMLHDMLIRHDEIFPKVQFLLDVWKKDKKEFGYQDPASILKIQFKKKKGRKEIDCGTAACALGSACMYPPFNKMGLRFKEDSWNINLPEYKGCTMFYAGCAFFKITPIESYEIFHPDWYGGKSENVTAKQVAVKVRNLIRSYEGRVE